MMQEVLGEMLNNAKFSNLIRLVDNNKSNAVVLSVQIIYDAFKKWQQLENNVERPEKFILPLNKKSTNSCLYFYEKVTLEKEKEEKIIPIWKGYLFEFVYLYFDAIRDALHQAHPAFGIQDITVPTVPNYISEWRTKVKRNLPKLNSGSRKLFTQQLTLEEEQQQQEQEEFSTSPKSSHQFADLAAKNNLELNKLNFKKRSSSETVGFPTPFKEKRAKTIDDIPEGDLESYKSIITLVGASKVSPLTLHNIAQKWENVIDDSTLYFPETDSSTASSDVFELAWASILKDFTIEH